MAEPGPSEQELRDAFDVVDKNGDGTISTQELKTVMGSLGLKSSEEDIRALMTKVDKDKNNSISFPEFVAMMKTMTPSPDKQLQDQFRILDKDGNGSISISELKDFAAALGLETTKKELEKMMKNNDCNGDGKLSFEEFKRIMAS